MFPFTKIINTLIDDETVNIMNGEELVGALKNICPVEKMSHTQWITSLAQNILTQFPEDSYLYQLMPALVKVI